MMAATGLSRQRREKPGLVGVEGWEQGRQAQEETVVKNPTPALWSSRLGAQFVSLGGDAQIIRAHHHRY